MKSIIFIAPPAAGKGTFSSMASKDYNLVHISTGDLLREEVAKDSDMSRKLTDVMNAGGLVSDEIIVSLLKQKLESISVGYILDGFPRNIAQAEILDNMLGELGQKLDYVIYLEVDKDTALSRTTGRISCPNCGEVYNTNIKGSEPREDNICDKCGSELVRRDDDNASTFIKRYDTYLEQTEPLIAYYKEKGILHSVDSSASKEEVYPKIKEIIND